MNVKLVSYCKEITQIEVFENKVMKIIFQPTRQEVIGRWRILHTEQFHSFCSSCTIITTERSEKNSHLQAAVKLKAWWYHKTERFLTDYINQKNVEKADIHKQCWMLLRLTNVTLRLVRFGLINYSIIIILCTFWYTEQLCTLHK
jgi:hypothetical protein